MYGDMRVLHIMFRLISKIAKQYNKKLSINDSFFIIQYTINFINGIFFGVY